MVTHLLFNLKRRKKKKKGKHVFEKCRLFLRHYYTKYCVQWITRLWVLETILDSTKLRIGKLPKQIIENVIGENIQNDNHMFTIFL